MIKPPKIPKLPTFGVPALAAGLPTLQHLQKMQSFREANRVFFDENVRMGDLFIIRNECKEFKHLVVSIVTGENIAAFTCDRIIKIFSFSRNCMIQFYRGPAYEGMWSGSFSEHDVTFSYNYSHLPLEINKIC